MNTLHESLANVSRLVRQINHVNPAAWGHDCLYRAVAKSHHTSNHGSLARLDDARAFCLGNQNTNFFVGDASLRLSAITEQPEQYPPGEIQQPYKGRANPRYDSHRRRHPHGDLLRISKCDLLWNKFANDQREISDDY